MYEDSEGVGNVGKVGSEVVDGKTKVKYLVTAAVAVAHALDPSGPKTERREGITMGGLSRSRREGT